MDPDFEVNRIIEEKDYYKILNVERNAEDSQIKKQYRKLAQIVHPDRCHNEKSTEAFQKLSQAYSKLSNPEERKKYDLYGDEPPRPQTQYYQEMHVEPEDLFSFIFGGPEFHYRRRQARNNAYYGYPGNAYRQRQNYQHQQQEAAGGAFAGFFSFFVILLFFFLTSGLLDFGKLKMAFSNPATRKNLKGIIRFDASDSNYFNRRSKKYRATYYIPNWWINSQRADLRNDILRKTDVIADELYEEDLIIKCELEKNQINREGTKCALKNRILKNTSR